jgi:hypothetical protein
MRSVLQVHKRRVLRIDFMLYTQAREPSSKELTSTDCADSTQLAKPPDFINQRNNALLVLSEIRAICITVDG